MQTNLLQQVLEKHHGLIDITTKVPVRDKYSLSLVYSPGVGESCMEIKRDVNETFALTNKSNSIIIISDGSANPVESDPMNYHMIPYIETLAVFYKEIYNIDAYPLILDSSRVQDIEKVYDTLYNLEPAYVGFELYGFSKERIQALQELYTKKPIPALLLTT